MTRRLPASTSVMRAYRHVSAVLDRISAWTDSARIAHRQSGSEDAKNAMLNYGSLERSLEAALQALDDAATGISELES